MTRLDAVKVKQLMSKGFSFSQSMKIVRGGRP